MRRRLVAAAMVAILAVCLAAGIGVAAVDVPISVIGNHHVGADAIRSHFRAGPGGNFNEVALDADLKSLYATGLFADVKISRDGERVVVTVVENPTIARLAFEGNKIIKDADLNKELHSKPNGPLWRAFVQGDAEQIVVQYRQRGYFDARVDPKTINVSDGRVNLVFEIREGKKLAVRKILFAGNAAFAVNKLSGVIKSGQTNVLSFLLNNDTYDADKIENDRDLLLRFYRSHGYADAQVGSSASYEADQSGVVLTFKIDEGPLYRFGAINITSSLKNADPAPLRSFLRTASGDVYDADAVEERRTVCRRVRAKRAVVRPACDRCHL
jgi:outer membrane protein insertion porin family